MRRLTRMRNLLARHSRFTAAAAALPVTALALAAAGCGGQAPAAVPAITRGVALPEPAASPVPEGLADTAFGLSVLSAWCRQQPLANIVLSPASLASGLGMAYLGARGSTALAMARVLQLPATGGPLVAGLQARRAALARLAGPGVAVSEADQVWADPSLPPSRGYLNAVATAYHAGVGRVPLLTDPARAVRQINAAIAAATRGGIRNLLTAGSVPEVGWMLTDALWLDARWAQPFDAALTSQGPFSTAAGQRASVRYLRGGSFTSVSAAGWTAVELPYRGGRLAMIAMLPGSGSGSCPALSAATVRAISARLSAAGSPGTPSLHPGGTAVALPQLNLSTKASMISLLSRLGMGVAFSSDADFSGLSAHAGKIGVVMHAATLRVEAGGTVASAATAVGIEPGAAPVPPRTVTFDRPYLLLVIDHATGEPLFLARVADPAAS